MIRVLQYEELKNLVCSDVMLDDVPSLFEKANEIAVFCRDNENFLGLTASQTGIDKKMFVIAKRSGEYQVVFNPVYYKTGKKISVMEECPSCDGRYIVDRSKEIQMVYYVFEKNNLVKKTGAIRGYESILYQHLTDIVNGVMIKDIGKKI